jgi:subtilase family serine protease
MSLNAGVTGDQFLLIIADGDGRQGETDEGNNAFSLPLHVDAPNLTLTGATAPALATVGTQIPVTWTVQNTGSVSAEASWIDAVYFGDDVFDQADTQPISNVASIRFRQGAAIHAR